MARILGTLLVLALLTGGVLWSFVDSPKQKEFIQPDHFEAKNQDLAERKGGWGNSLQYGGLQGNKAFNTKNQAIRASPDSETAYVVNWIRSNIELYHKSGGRAGISLEDAKYIRFFTRYTLPAKLKAITWDCLSFIVNSTAHFTADTFPYPVIPLNGTDLAYIDIRNYNWDQKTLEIVSGQDPYFAEPLVIHEVPGYGRIVSGNLVFRADWVVFNWMDTTKQDDRGEKDLIYYILQYGKGKEPKNADEFRDFWKVNIKEIREERLEIGTIVNKGDSGVSRHTRQLRRARTIYGYYHETRDVKSHDNDPVTGFTRDYLEDLFANQADAMEYILSNKRSLQVYFLTAGNNDKFKRIESGDTAVVVDRSDKDDVRVRTAKSCITCHAVGINPSTNEVRRLLLSGAELKTYSHELKQELKAFYLKNQNTLVEDDNRLYERAMKECNGLDPIENAKNFVELYNWYNKDVTPEQAALEWGLTLSEFKERVRGGVTGRMVTLYRGSAIPRETWDSLNAGVYTQAGLLIKRITRPVKNQGQPPPKLEIPQKIIPVFREQVIVIRNNVPLEAGQKRVLAYLPLDTIVNVLKSEPDWYFVEYRGLQGWLHADYVRKVKK